MTKDSVASTSAVWLGVALSRHLSLSKAVCKELCGWYEVNLVYSADFFIGRSYCWLHCFMYMAIHAIFTTPYTDAARGLIDVLRQRAS